MSVLIGVYHRGGRGRGPRLVRLGLTASVTTDGGVGGMRQFRFLAGIDVESHRGFFGPKAESREEDHRNGN